MLGDRIIGSARNDVRAGRQRRQRNAGDVGPERQRRGLIEERQDQRGLKRAAAPQGAHAGFKPQDLKKARKAHNEAESDTSSDSEIEELKPSKIQSGRIAVDKPNSAERRNVQCPVKTQECVEAILDRGEDELPSFNEPPDSPTERKAKLALQGESELLLDYGWMNPLEEFNNTYGDEPRPEFFAAPSSERLPIRKGGIEKKKASAHVRRKHIPICFLCNGEHYADQCTKYTTFEQRDKRATELNLCRRCLIAYSAHKFKIMCRSRPKPCIKCGGTHHYALCPRAKEEAPIKKPEKKQIPESKDDKKVKVNNLSEFDIGELMEGING